jgi:diadenosine tetraphosphate (Ap4A) HIT family hydrolase
MVFSLHPQLAKDCFVLGELSLCQVLLMNDARYPWFILVPKRADMSEIYQLTATDQQQLAMESSLIGKRVMDLFGGDKLNIATLGNIVPQLHIHHVVRYQADSAWPAPIWGRGEAVAYLPEELDAIREVTESLFT